jgi:hypothetical protein
MHRELKLTFAGFVLIAAQGYAATYAANPSMMFPSDILSRVMKCIEPTLPLQVFSSAIRLSNDVSNANSSAVNKLHIDPYARGVRDRLEPAQGPSETGTIHGRAG